MKTLFLTLIFLTGTGLQADELWLRVGEIRSLKAQGAATVRVGTRGIVRVVDAGASIQIIGLKPGTTTITVGRASHRIHVNIHSQRDFAFKLKGLLKEMMGLRLETDSHTLTIRGTLLRLSDWLEIAELAKQKQGEYTFAAQALPDVAEAALKHLTLLSQKHGVPVIRFRADPGFRAILPKTISTLREEASQVFSPYGIKIDASGNGLALQPLVRTRVILAEVSKQESTDFGVEWPSTYQAQILPKISSAEDGVIARLHALQSQGRAQILASPNLLCRSGSEAQFHAGGELPIRMVSRHSQEVQWKQHGVILHVRPKADFQGAISLEIESEISLLDMANAVDGTPALKSNSVKSHFDLPGKRTIALSGLLRQQIGDSKAGLPYLSGLPILGALFGSRQYMKQLTELVIFVTPEIYVPDQDEKIEMPSGWVKNDL